MFVSKHHAPAVNEFRGDREAVKSMSSNVGGPDTQMSGSVMDLQGESGPCRSGRLDKTCRLHQDSINLQRRDKKQKARWKVAFSQAG